MNGSCGEKLWLALSVADLPVRLPELVANVQYQNDITNHIPMFTQVFLK
jgi:hypothetical protein